MLLFRVHQASDRDSHVPDTRLSRSAQGGRGSTRAPRPHRGRLPRGRGTPEGFTRGRRAPDRPTEQNAARPRGSEAAAAAATPGPACAETRSGPHSLT